MSSPSVAVARPADSDRHGLTPREREILTLLARGLTAQGIAHVTGTSVRTVDKHLEHTYRKLGCGDRLTAVLTAQQSGLLPPPPPLSPTP
jgi:DNA-binding NarL/FixJ family response regulator